MNTTRWTSPWIAVFTLTLLAPAALAFAEPDTSQATAPTRSAETTTFQVLTREGAVSVRIEDGRATATLNGAPIPAGHVSMTDGVLRVRDDAGKTIVRLNIPGVEDARKIVNVRAPNARRIIGVITNPVGGALAAQLGLEPGAALVIESVLPGLPAATAGLKPWDVVTAIDGASPVTLDRLRAAISKKTDDEALRLSVLRTGTPLTISVVPTTETMSGLKVPLDAFDARDFARAFGMAQAAAPSRWRLSPDAVQRLQREAVEARSSAQGVRGAVQAQLKRLAHDATIDAGKRAEIERALRGAAEALGNITFDPVAGLPEVRFIKDGGKGVALFPCVPMNARLAQTPPEPSVNTGVDERLARVERRLERLESLLEHLLETPTAEPVPKPASENPQDKQPGA